MSQHQRWAEGPIVRSPDTDSILRLYPQTQTVDFRFPFFTFVSAILPVRCKIRFFKRPIVCFVLKLIGRLYRSIWNRLYRCIGASNNLNFLYEHFCRVSLSYRFTVFDFSPSTLCIGVASIYTNLSTTEPVFVNLLRSRGIDS
jgi:hypothetical protein